jgi:hypothetical protein
MLRRLIGIDLFSALAFNIIALLGTLFLSIMVAFVPLALVIAGVNVILLSMMLLVRLGALARLIDHVTRKR